MLTLLDFKGPGIEDLLLDLQGMEKYASAHSILTKISAYTEDELRGEIGSVSVLVTMLAEYLRSDVRAASIGTLSYFYNLKMIIKTLSLSELTLFELMMYQEMIDNIEKISVPTNR